MRVAWLLVVATSGWLAAGCGGDGDGGGGGGEAGLPGDDGALRSDATPGGDGGGGDGGGPGPGPRGCTAIVRDQATVATTPSDRFAWSDGDCQRRSAAFARTGGYLRQVTYPVGGQQRVVTGTGSNGWNGWGYVVMHYGNTAATSRGATPTLTDVLAGPHHAIYQEKLRLMAGGPVDVTIHWLIATGRSHPIFSITMDTMAAGADVVNADSRSPYGDLDWDGVGAVGDDEVEGVGWGDKLMFRTTGTGSVTPQTPWRYDQANVIPHVLEWSQRGNAEMGAVALLPWDLESAGGDYGAGLLDACWNKTSANPGTGCRPAGQVMPQDWLWPYQLNQYELPFVTNSRRLAWGSNFGLVGQRSVTAFGRTLSGWPRTSYAVSMVLGQHAPSAVDAELAMMAAAARARLTASRGSLVTMGPGGVGRTDAVTWKLPGYDPAYGVWTVRAAAGGGATVTLDAPVALAAPMLRVLDFSASAPGVVTVRSGGRTLVAGEDYFATLDAAGRALWLTVNATVTGRLELTID